MPPRVRVNTILGAAVLASAVAAAAAASDESPLVAAVKRQDRQAVRTLLEQKAGINARQPDGATALHWAVYRDDAEIVELLIRAGADVNAANDVGMSPLIMACTSGQGSIVERLLRAGARPNGALASGETPLMRAARVGNTAAVDALLASGAEVNAQETTRRQTALMWAVANRQPMVVKALLAAGADVNARSEATAAVYNMGGSRSAGTGNRETTIHQIPQGGNTPLLFAARSGDVDSARLLVGAGARVNDTGADGNTALIVAAHSGHASLASFLIESGADVNAAPLGYTALHAAVLRGTLRDRNVSNPDPMAGAPLVRMLIAAGAVVDLPFTNGTPLRRWSHDFVLHERWIGATPFWLAAKFLEVEIMRSLGAGGANPNLPSADGTTPLMAAAGDGYSRGGGEGAFIRDRRDFSSYNPVAAEGGASIPAEEERLAREAVRTALELGAVVTTGNGALETPLHAAAALGMTSVVRELVDHGADVNARNKAGQSPLDVARRAAGRDKALQGTVDLLRSLGAR
jgi:ankyrin repeat protein